MSHKSFFGGAAFLTAALTAGVLAVNRNRVTTAPTETHSWEQEPPVAPLTYPIAVQEPTTYGQEMALSIPAHDIMWKSAAERRRTIGLIKATGVQWVRTDLWLHSITWENQDQIDWEPIDVMVEDLRAQGIRIVFTVHTLPSYAGVLNPRTGPSNQRQRDIYTNLIVRAVERYKNDVQHWEIWDEPNRVTSWGTPSWHQYSLLLSQVYPAIKQEDPSAVVLSGGTGVKTLPEDVDALEYLTSLYTSTDFRDNCDGLSIHAHANMRQPDIGEFFQLPRYRELMDKHGDENKQLWITEGGAGTIAGDKTASEANQTGVMPQMVNAWAQTHHHGPLCWFSLYDSTPGYGFIRPDGMTKRPSFYTLQAITSHKV